MPPAIQSGQKLRSLAPINAPIATSAPQAGMTSEPKASDSAKASANMIGTVIGAGELNFWPIWIAGSVGAALGDWISYWVGKKLEYTVQHIWPLSRHPDLIPKGEAFIKKWGALGIFIGRFSGPLRASVPLVAGIFEMPFWRFQLANWVSAFVWAGVLLTLGDVFSKGLKMIFG